MIVTNATNELLEEFYGEPLKKSVKSVVVVDNGKPLGVSGLKVENDYMVWFADISDELREHKSFKRVVIECYRKLMEVLPRMPVYSLADPRIEGSDKLLAHIGFEHVRGNIWRV